MPEPPQRVVRAAGTLCWRRTARGDLRLLVVRNARWDEWGWPKGKLDRGETLAECAVRETLEETGITAALGAPLPPSAYVMPDGQPKEVSYWSARVAHEGAATADADEIGDVAWVTPGHARLLVRDDAPLRHLLELDRAGRLDAPRLLVVRHAKARRRERWDGAEADRPLTGTGRRQAQALVRLLGCWAPARLPTSPWERCVQTVQPYADATGIAPEPVPMLTEASHEADPGAVEDAVAALLDSDPATATALCTHRPVLASIMKALRRNGIDGVTGQLPDADPWLAPAEILVVHHTAGIVFRVESHRINRP